MFICFFRGDMKKSGIYIHIPFCVKRCSYCDFYSTVIKDRGKMKIYGKKVISELIDRFDELNGSEVVSLYVGGGTPSTMDEEFFSDLLNAVSELGCNIKKMEITVEANPADISDKWLKSLRNSGVNRISAGVQAFGDNVLKEMNRRVSVEEMKKALPLINDNFDNISIDMIYGIGKERNIAEELENVFKLVNPVHVSAYQYTPPEKKSAPMLIDEDETIRQEEAVVEFLKKRGIEKYEISNYSKKGKESVHNMLYWNFDSWLGIGAGAKSFIENKREHSFYAEDVESFINGDGLSRYYPDKNELIMEFLLMGLRVVDGIKLNKFKDIFKRSFEQMFEEKVVDELKKDDLIVVDKSVIKCSENGLNFLNHVLLRLFDGIKE